MATNITKGIAPKSIVPDVSTNPGGAEAEIYSWTIPRSAIIIQNLSSSAATMYVKLNADAAAEASVTLWDVVLAPGDQPFTTGGLFDVKSVAVYFSAAAAIGTDFMIRGW